jgi:hypothetical protein
VILKNIVILQGDKLEVIFKYSNFIEWWTSSNFKKHSYFKEWLAWSYLKKILILQSDEFEVIFKEWWSQSILKNMGESIV